MYKENINRGKVIIWIKKIIICFFSIVVLGISIGLNVNAALGTDPISVLFDGSSNITGIDIGLVTNLINIALVIVVLIIDRKYMHVGTVIYAIFLGISIKWGIGIYDFIGLPNTFLWRLIISLIGCFLAFVSLGAYITIDIGVDPWSAIALIISKRIGKQYKIVRMSFDFVCMAIGFLLGGTVGIITIFSAFAGGPIIQKASEVLDNVFTQMLKSKKA